MRNKLLKGVLLGLAGLFVTACSEDDFFSDADNQQQQKIEIGGEIEQVYTTRVNDGGFCDKDEMGIYITDYNGSTPSELLLSGNRADNVGHVFDEASNKWVADRDIFWKNKTTHVDIYGYYPYSSPSSIKAYEFEVMQNQGRGAENGIMGGYEASDFLWAKAENVAPTDQVIRLSFNHKMATIRVTLVQGTGFAEGEWTALDKDITVLNTVRKSNIDLSTGMVTAVGTASPKGIVPFKNGDDYKAIVVPQTIKMGNPLFGITVGGVPYKYTKKTENFVYNPGKMHNFTITINKKEGSGFEFVPGSESITAWENDNITHNAEARAYLVIDVPDYGKLKETMVAAKKDFTTIKNLKLTGKINDQDFYFMRDEMSDLQALNLKDVNVLNDEIPFSAMSSKKSLLRLVLPDKLVCIREWAFYECSNIVGSLIIPEGVVSIEGSAFFECKSMTGTLSLPSTLEVVRSHAFSKCGFSGQLILPDNLKVIEEAVFDQCSNLTGELHLPKNLEVLGRYAFAHCIGFTGSVKIPDKIKYIGEACFAFEGVNGWYKGNYTGKLTLPKDLISIEPKAFIGAGFKGELILPKDLVIIPDYAFYDCDFSGNLTIPAHVATIGSYAFYGNSRLTGELVIPKEVQSIGASAFYDCQGLESIILEDGLETIGRQAFYNCTGVKRIVSKAAIPPSALPEAFMNMDKANVIVEVPNKVINDYKLAPEWCEFKNIVGYRNFIASPYNISAINTKATRKITINTKESWVLESKPDWVTVDKTSGTGTTEVTVTFTEMSVGTPNREGEVVFKLTDEDIRTRCNVKQFYYEHAEDAIITLNEATVGKGVNLMFIGDGYNAEEISSGKYMNDINEAVGHFFGLEPYISYKKYFNVYAGIAVSQESGIGGVNTIVNNRFNTIADEDGMLCARNGETDRAKILEYACKAPTIDDSNLAGTLIIMIPNTTDYSGITFMYDDGCSIAYCPKSLRSYPFDFRGTIQHEAGGHGFGKLANEAVYRKGYIDESATLIVEAQKKGWYSNISITGKANKVPWAHFITNPKYSAKVDVFEGGFSFSRGVYHSQQLSCMDNNVPYYNVISREAIVKRIKELAGEQYSLDDFLKNDNDNVPEITPNQTTRNGSAMFNNASESQNMPVMLKHRPQVK